MKYVISRMHNTPAGAQTVYMASTDPRTWTPDIDKALKFGTPAQAGFYIDKRLGDETLTMYAEKGDGPVTVPSKL